MKNWIQRRWQELRFGYSIYMAMPIALAGTSTVLFKLLIIDNEILSPFFPNYSTFIIALVSFAVPLAIIFGHLHSKHQLEIDQAIGIRNNPLSAKITRILLKSIRGTASLEEMDWLESEMISIEEGKG